MLRKIPGVTSPHQNKGKSSYQYTSCPQRVFEEQSNKGLTHSFDFIKANIKNWKQDITPIMTNVHVG